MKLRTASFSTALLVAALLEACSSTDIPIGRTRDNILNGDGGAQTDAAGPCIDSAGVSHQLGDHFPAADGCNTCSCTVNGIACTEIGCATICVYGGQNRQPGDSFPASDGCNTCSCGADGRVVCTAMACSPGCVQNGHTYQPGETFSPDGCNSCTCESTGTIACTATMCNCPADGTINCMPPTQLPACVDPYHQWVIDNCPNVRFVY